MNPSDGNAAAANLTGRVNRVAAPGGVKSAPKKLTIKPFKAKPKVPDNFEETTWNKLHGAVRAVHAKQPVESSLEELYQAVEDMCLQKLGKNLYGHLEEACKLHVASKIKGLLAQGQCSPVVFLSFVEDCWKDHCSQMLTVRSIFLYLDRTYVIQTQGVASLWDMGLGLFRSHLAQHAEVERKTVEGLLSLVESERSGETVNRALLKNLLRMFSSLGIYAESFEKSFLQQTQGFYHGEGARYMEQTDVPDYLVHCEQRLREETDRCHEYLDASTRKPLIAIVEAELLQRHTAAMLEKGFDPLMDAARTSDLSRMYSLLGRVDAHKPLQQALSTYVKRTGRGVVTNEDEDANMVASLLELKERLDSMVEEAFGRNEGFAGALKEAFESFINQPGQRQSRPAELIAKFIDGKLRSGNKGQSDEELEALLDKVLILFRYIQGKDVFEAFYKKDLAKRLLLGRSASIDAEKSVISKLKTECGSQFTNKIEGMFKDIDLSRDIMNSFRSSATARAKLPPGIEMNVHVLTTGYWPTYTPMEVRMPVELSQYQDIFKDFYLSKHSGRRLMWQCSLGHCVLKSRFPKGTKELSVSLFQAVVLMLFNDVDSLTYTDIKDATGIEEKELKRTLQSLACGKVGCIL